MQQLKDVHRGGKKEKTVFKFLQAKYKDIEKSTDTFSWWDFKSDNKKIIFELKSPNDKYSDLEYYNIGKDKVDKYYKSDFKKNGYKFVLLYFIKGHLIKTILNRKCGIVKKFRRTDRGNCDKLKDYYFIKREDFIFYTKSKKCSPIFPLDHYKIDISWMEDEE